MTIPFQVQAAVVVLKNGDRITGRIVKMEKQRLSFFTAVHFGHKIWTSGLAGDERNGAYQNMYEGDLTLAYRLTDSIQGFGLIQRSSPKESFESIPSRTPTSASAYLRNSHQASAWRSRQAPRAYLVSLVCLVVLVHLVGQSRLADFFIIPQKERWLQSETSGRGDLGRQPDGFHPGIRRGPAFEPQGKF